MEKHVFVARQPIVSPDNTTFAYELLFRGCDTINRTPSECDEFDDTFATANVVSTVMNQFGLDQVVGDLPAFINIDKDFIFDDLLQSIPKELFIFEILETIEITPEIIERVKYLSSQGFRFAVDDIILNEDFFGVYGELIQYLEVLKIDFPFTSKENFTQWMPRLKKLGLKILAEKVETKEDVDFCNSLGIDLFQGYFFAKPTTLKHTSINPEAMAVLNIIAMIDKDSALTDIVEVFSNQVEITVQLLRFINSASTSLKAPIKSITHAITLLGLKPLRNWLLMLAFSQSIGDGSASNNPLFTLAKSRSKIMEGLAKASHLPLEDRYEASFIGLVSLLDALFQSPIESILVELNVSDVIIQAILHNHGIMGEFLQLTMAIEQFDQIKITEHAFHRNIPTSALEDVLLTAYKFSIDQ